MISFKCPLSTSTGFAFIPFPLQPQIEFKWEGNYEKSLRPFVALMWLRDGVIYSFGLWRKVFLLVTIPINRISCGHFIHAVSHNRTWLMVKLERRQRNCWHPKMKIWRVSMKNRLIWTELLTDWRQKKKKIELGVYLCNINNSNPLKLLSSWVKVELIT